MIPNKLEIGQTIGILSPSDPIEDEEDKQFNAGIQSLEGLGFKIIKGNHLNPRSPQEKAEDIHSLFSNKEVHAIICSQGGDSAEEALPHINWETIKHNPKIFSGISDITVLLNAITHKTGLVTFHGNDIKWGFGRNPTAYDKREFVERLIEGKIGEVNLNRESKTIRKGVVRGKLLGGNLHCLLKLAHTEFWPNFENSILMLEAYHLTEEACLKHFEELKKLRVFDKVKGVIIGFIYGMQIENPESEQMEDILLQFTKDYDFPILKVNAFGHNCPNTPLPIGCRVELNADDRKIIILENCVK